jgi:hypothetical protein
LKKKIKVIERKLGRERIDGDKIWGYAIKQSQEMHVDPRQKPKDLMETFVHEGFHLIFPELDEEYITKRAKLFNDLMWELGYRRTKK